MIEVSEVVGRLALGYTVEEVTWLTALFYNSIL